jgi:hypothetical protein
MMMNITESSTCDPKAVEQQMADLFGPGQVDQTIRQAIHFCWMALPRDRKNAEELERQIRRIVERALRDFREDTAEFGSQAVPQHGSRPAPKGKKKSPAR